MIINYFCYSPWTVIFGFMVVDGITQSEVQCCAICQGTVAQEVTVIFGAVEAYFAYIAVQPFTFPAAISAAIHAILRQDWNHST